MGRKNAEWIGSKPKIFVASSVEGLEAARAVAANFEYDFEVTTWDQADFKLTADTLSSLIGAFQLNRYGVFVLTPDDVKQIRGTGKRVARDNVIFELGLCIGANSRERSFMIAPRNAKLDFPTDLLGLTVATYESDRSDGNVKAALVTPCEQVRSAIKNQEANQDTPKESTLEVAKTPQVTAPAVTGHVEAVTAAGHFGDLLKLLCGGSAGLAIAVEDPKRMADWTKNVLAMARDVFLPRTSDVYAVWLRPMADNAEELQVYESEGSIDAERHYRFTKGDGLAGNVWSSGESAFICPGKSHRWWKVRSGCDNATYVCAAVGEREGIGGVLAVGSTRGFAVTEADAATLEIFAAFLAFTVDRGRPAILNATKSTKHRGAS